MSDAARIYRERYPKPGTPATLQNVKWEPVTTTLEDIKTFTDYYLKSRSFTKDRALQTKLKEEIIPRVEELTQVRTVFL